MDKHIQKITELHIEKTIKALEANNMMAIYVPTIADVVPKVTDLLNEGDTVSFGGSMSLYEAGVIDHLRSGRYHCLDRDAPGLSREQVNRIQREAFSADAYLCSAGAVTMNGEIYSVDGNSNRVAATLFGPASVIMVVGTNKLVHDLDGAVTRVKTVAAPANAARLDCDTYCAHKGECTSFSENVSGMTTGCTSPGRICCSYIVCAYQRHKERIKVILVGEALGY
ncbi:MAG: lactate utilization protein [Acetanaerobacterium sp.]